MDIEKEAQGVTFAANPHSMSSLPDDVGEEQAATPMDVSADMGIPKQKKQKSTISRYSDPSITTPSTALPDDTPTATKSKKGHKRSSAALLDKNKITKIEEVEETENDNSLNY